jgi:hypothetical protein
MQPAGLVRYQSVTRVLHLFSALLGGLVLLYPLVSIPGSIEGNPRSPPEEGIFSGRLR